MTLMYTDYVFVSVTNNQGLGYVYIIPDSFCVAQKIIPDRDSEKLSKLCQYSISEFSKLLFQSEAKCGLGAIDLKNDFSFSCK